MGLEVLKATNIMTIAFWNLTPCRLVDGSQHFGNLLPPSSSSFCLYSDRTSGFFPSEILNRMLYGFFLSMSAAYPAYHILLDYNMTLFGEKYKKWSISSNKFSPSLLTFFVFDPNILHSTQFSKYLSYNKLTDMLLFVFCVF
jgi:hypothetical protein